MILEFQNNFPLKNDSTEIWQLNVQRKPPELFLTLPHVHLLWNPTVTQTCTTKLLKQSQQFFVPDCFDVIRLSPIHKIHSCQYVSIYSYQYTGRYKTFCWNSHTACTTYMYIYMMLCVNSWAVYKQYNIPSIRQSITWQYMHESKNNISPLLGKEI